MSKTITIASIQMFVHKNKKQNVENQIIVNKFPIDIFKLIESINIKFLKIKFRQQS